MRNVKNFCVNLLSKQSLDAYFVLHFSLLPNFLFFFSRASFHMPSLVFNGIEMVKWKFDYRFSGRY